MPHEKGDQSSPQIKTEAPQNTMPREFYTAKELLDMNVQSIPFLWDSIFPQKGIGFITGPSDTNKSTFLRQLAYAIIQKKNEFLGRRLTVRHGRVIIVSIEDNEIAIAAILRKQNAFEISDEQLLNLGFQFKRIKNLDHLAAIIRSNPIDMLGLDTWTDNFHGDLNSAVAVREFINGYKELADDNGFLVLGIHHSKKGSDTQTPNKSQMLGSQSIEGHSRAVIDIRRESDLRRRLTIVKGNYTPDEVKKSPMLLELNPENMTLSVTDPSSGFGFEKFRGEYNIEKEDYMAIITEMYEQGNSQDETVKYLEEKYPDRRTPSKGTVNKWLQEWKQKKEQADKQ